MKYFKLLLVVSAIFIMSGDIYAQTGITFINNGDETITDTVSQLMWQQSDNGETYNWSSAETYCENLVLGDYDDWGLPTMEELHTLEDGDYKPAINPGVSEICDNGIDQDCDGSDLTCSTDSFLTYNNEAEGFQIKYPGSWSVKNILVVFIAFMSPNESPSDDFLENVNIVFEETTLPLEEYTITTIDILDQFLTDFDLLESESTTFAGRAAHKVIYTGTKNNLKFMQIWTIKNNEAYILTYTAKVGAYSRFLDTVHDMCNSFYLN